MIVAEKLGNDLSSLPNYDNYYKQGESGELVVYVQRPLDYEELEQLETRVIEKGIDLQYVKQDAKMLVIGFRRQSFPLAILAGALAVLTGIILGWQLFKTVTVPTWVWVAGGVVGIFCIYKTVTRRKKNELGTSKAR